MNTRTYLVGAIRGLAIFFIAIASEAATIEVTEFGGQSGRPVVFIPGLASSASLWTPWADKLAPTHNVHAVGVNGFAGLPSAGSLSVAAIAQDLADYLDEKNLIDAVIVGHSVGGMIAMQTAVLSDRVGKLVLVDSLPFTAELFMPGITPEAAGAMAESLRAGMQSTPEEMFRAQQRAGLSVYSKNADFLQTLIEWSDSSDIAAVTDIYTELVATDFRAEIANIDIPIHAIAAWDMSMNVPRQQVEDIFTEQYSARDGVDLTIIDESLHFIMIDQPEAFAAALSNVLGEQK